MSVLWKTVLLLVCSNVFMTFAWYGHLKDLRAKPLWIAIVASWSIAFLSAVPGTRRTPNSTSLMMRTMSMNRLVVKGRSANCLKPKFSACR